MEYLKIHQVASSVNDTNVITYLNMAFVHSWVTAASTCTIRLKGMDTGVEIMNDTITITTAGIADTLLVSNGLHSLMSSSYNSKAARTVGAGFNGAKITTITVATAVA